MSAIAAVALVSASRSTAPSSLSADAYLDRALALMEANDVSGAAVDWPAVSRRAHAMAASAKTTAGTYAAIEYALGELHTAGDLHANFYNPLTAKLLRSAPDVTATPPPSVSLAGDRLGDIQLQAVNSQMTTANGRRYAAVALSAIARLQQQSHPCGWIVDLQADEGGNVVPMILSVGPILGEGRVAGFTGRKGYTYSIAYQANTFSENGYTAHAPITAAPITPAPPVAVVYGSSTASAGELVAVAFRGRPHTRSFGAVTAGYTTGPQFFHLPDGAALFLGTVYYVDRNGVVYRRALQPDVQTSEPDAVGTAARWLLAQPACVGVDRRSAGSTRGP